MDNDKKAVYLENIRTIYFSSPAILFCLGLYAKPLRPQLINRPHRYDLNLEPRSVQPLGVVFQNENFLQLYFIASS